MRYRLGEFLPQPGSGMFAWMLEDEVIAPAVTANLETMLRVPLGPARLRNLPEPAALPPEALWRKLRQRLAKPRRGAPAFKDLLQVLTERHPDCGWVANLHAGLARVQKGGVQVRLLACEHEPGPRGFLAIAAVAPSVRVEVMPRDWMQAGVAAIRDGGRGVRIHARLFREVCANGSIVSSPDLEERDPSEQVRETVERFLSPAYVHDAVETLRVADRIEVVEPGVNLDEVQLLLHPIAPRIERRWRDGENPTLYGLMNAVTAEARDVPDWRERLRLEELAGRLARLRPPVPSRSGAGALVPA